MARCRCTPGAFVSLFLAALLALVAGCGNDEGDAPNPDQANRGSTMPASPTGEEPNFVIVMTDDQEIDSLRFMPNLQRLVIDKGVSFPNMFTSYPLCCPARATFQTGQHAHNHGVKDNKEPKGGYGVFDPSETLAVWLQRAGYETAMTGKYINDYHSDDGVPPGWDDWHALNSPAYAYFGANVFDDGKQHPLGKGYSTDRLTDHAVEVIEEQEGSDPPFFLQLGYIAPHVAKSTITSGHCDQNGPEPAPRHLGAFKGRQIPRNPAFNEDDISDKPESVRKQDKLRGKLLRDKTDKYQCRLETLLAVDEGVERIVGALRDSGELENTYVLFTSDNGFIQGEHRFKGGKSVPYENSIRVPLVVSGPGIPSGTVAEELVTNADFVTTIADLAGAESGLDMDGVSFAPSLLDPNVVDGRAALIEAFRKPKFSGVRTARYTYVERKKEESELYDLREDPFQLENVYDSPEYSDAQAALAKLTDQLRDCKGADCESSPRLKLSVERSDNGPGPSCKSGVAVATVRGSDSGEVVATGLRGGESREDGNESREVEISPGESSSIEIFAELLDGREARLSANVKGC